MPPWNHNRLFNGVNMNYPHFKRSLTAPEFRERILSNPETFLFLIHKSIAEEGGFA